MYLIFPLIHYLYLLPWAAVLTFFWIVFYLSICVSKQCLPQNSPEGRRPSPPERECCPHPSWHDSWALEPDPTFSFAPPIPAQFIVINPVTFKAASAPHTEPFRLCLCAFEFCVSATTLEPYPALWDPQDSTLPEQVKDTMCLVSLYHITGNIFSITMHTLVLFRP